MPFRRLHRGVHRVLRCAIKANAEGTGCYSRQVSHLLIGNSSLTSRDILLSFFSLSLTHPELSVHSLRFRLSLPFPSDPHDRTRTCGDQGKRPRRGQCRQRAHTAREITLAKRAAGCRAEPSECFPGLIKIRNDLFPGTDPFLPLSAHTDCVLRH